jgi:hypothetical protein
MAIYQYYIKRTVIVLYLASDDYKVFAKHTIIKETVEKKFMVTTVYC